MFSKEGNCSCNQSLNALDNRIKELEKTSQWYTEEYRTNHIANRVVELLTEKAGQEKFNMHFISSLVSMLKKSQLG